MSDIEAARPSSGKLIGGGLACAGLAPAILAAGLLIETRAQSGGAVPAVLLIGWCAASLLILRTLGAHPHPRFGPANALTAARAAGVLVLAALAAAPALPGPWIAAAGLAILLLDGLDGRLARRSGLASAYGARFDMEVDAALTLVLSMLAWRGGAAGPEIVLLVAPYYLVSALRPALPWLASPLAPSFRRKAVCVVQMATPIALLALPPAPGAARAIVLCTLAAILASFMRDIRRLAAQRR